MIEIVSIEDFLSTTQTTQSDLEIADLIFPKNFTACTPSLEKGTEKPNFKLEFFIIILCKN